MNIKPKRSPLFYVGDKYKLLTQIIPLFPSEINNFIEPFVGGGSVFLNVNAKNYYLNDVNKHIIGIHEFLISQSINPDKFYADIRKILNKYNLSKSYLEDIIPELLKLDFKKTYYAEFNRKGFINLRNSWNQRKTEYLELYLLLIYGFNRMMRFNSNGNFNVPVGNVDFNDNVVQALNNYFECTIKKNITWYNEDYLTLLNQISFKKGDFVYIDPPYLITFSEYNKQWKETDEINLLSLMEKLNKEGVKFAISNVTHYKGRENKILLDWLKDYYVYPIKSNYISYHDNSVKIFKEVLITNYVNV